MANVIVILDLVREKTTYIHVRILIMFGVRGRVVMDTEDAGQDGLKLSPAESFGVAIRHLEGHLGIYSFYNAHFICFIES
jgi:hypothetical protein